MHFNFCPKFGIFAFMFTNDHYYSVSFGAQLFRLAFDPGVKLCFSQWKTLLAKMHQLLISEQAL